MKRIVRIVTLFLLMTVVSTLFIATKPASAGGGPVDTRIFSASCQNGVVSATWDDGHGNPIGAGETTYIKLWAYNGNTWHDFGYFYLTAPNGGVITNIGLNYQLVDVYGYDDSIGDWTYKRAACGGNTPLFNDGRLDANGAYQPVSVYCADKTLIAYAMFQSKGYLAFKITQAEIDRFPKHPAQNTLIKEAKGVRLYRLTSGELQINRATEDGGEYSLKITVCVS
jgi:hypothetical protein